MALITAQQVASECINDVNFDETLIKDGYILAAQLDYIKPYLGDDFYDALVADDASYSDLTAKLYPALKWYAYYKALPFLQLRVTNQGVAKFRSDYADKTSDKQKADLSKEALAIAKVYLDECTRFLEDNASDYPLWERQTDNKKGDIIFYDSLEEIYNSTKTFYDYEDE